MGKNGAAIHCRFPAVTFDETFRSRLEKSLAAIGMYARSVTLLYETLPPEHNQFRIVAYYFPAGEVVTLKLIDWVEPGSLFQRGDSIHVMFMGFPGGAEQDHYWNTVLHFSAQSQINLVAIITQVEPLADYEDDDRKAWNAMRTLAASLHREFQASGTEVRISGEDNLETWFEFRAGSDALIPGKHPLP